MCGIAGYFGPKAIARPQIDSCLAQLYRRGPDYQDSAHFAAQGHNCYLLSTRLRIIDLNERANQPFHYNGKTLVYNGEIYNYIEIREQLIQQGHQFVTASDTEVLIHALDAWGVAAFNRIEGMWALALYSHHDNSVLLARDPFGEKPLYYTSFGDRQIYFASQIDCLQTLSGQKLTPNLDHVTRHLVNGYRSLFKTDETFFNEVHNLPAGHYLQCPANGLPKKSRYWQPKMTPNPDMGFDQAVAQTREAMIETVRLRLRGDVPAAFHVSGGIDCNAMVGIAKHILGYDVQGFTIRNKDKRYEENDMIDLAIKSAGIVCEDIYPDTTGFMEHMHTMVAYNAGPVATLTNYVNWLMTKTIADKGYRVSISGLGADELFAGYYDHHLMYLYDIRHDSALLAQKTDEWRNHIAPIVRNPYLQNPDVFFNNPHMRDHLYMRTDELRTRLVGKWEEGFSEAQFCDGLLNNRRANEIFCETVPLMLYQDDLNAMYYSVENRSPFLDRNLLELVYSIPVRHMIKQAKGKAVLREAMRGIVDERILDNRRKVGLNLPVFDVIGEDRGRMRDMLLSDSPIFDLVDRSAIETLLGQAELANSDSMFLFAFITNKIFLEIHS